jgi:hypothetical protein
LTSPITHSLPTYEQGLNPKGQTSSVWYRFFQGVYQGKPPALEATQTAATSPYTFTASQKGFLIVQGGTVSMVQFSRGGAVNYNTGVTQGCFPVSAGDSIIVTYSVVPNTTFVPQ